MKQKDIILIGIAILIFVITGYLLVGALQPKKTSQTGESVEVAMKIEGTMNADILKTMSDPTKMTNFAVYIDLHTGLGNTKPFGLK